MNYFSGADMLSVSGGLAFLCFLGLRVIITPRTQHTLSTAHVHLDKVPTTIAYPRTDLYRITIRQKISVWAYVSYLQKLRIFKTGDVLTQIFLDNIALFSMGFCFIAFSLKLNTLSF